MTMFNDMRAALETQLSTTSSIPPIAYPNIQYEQMNGTTFIKANTILFSRRPAVVGPSPQQRYEGFFNLLICTPEDKGAGASMILLDTLMARFEAHTDILYTNPSAVQRVVSIEYSEPGYPYLDSPFYCTPLTVKWYSYK
jgi:hypothetical protein